MTMTNDTPAGRFLAEALADLAARDAERSAAEAYAELEALARASQLQHPASGKTRAQWFTEHLERRRDLAARIFPQVRRGRA